MGRIYINIGKKGVSQGILGALINETGISKEVGDIDMYDKFTFVDIPLSTRW